MEGKLAVKLPTLRWRIGLETGSKLERAIAHSFATYELVFNYGESFSEAHLVDVRQGVIWSDLKRGLQYVARGVRLDNDKIVDVSGEVLLKLGFKPSEAIMGRRVVVLHDNKHVKIVDRAMLTEEAGAKTNFVYIDNDEYTLAAVFRRRKKLLLLADTIYGYIVDGLERQPSLIKARRGCVVACSRFSCKATNGSYTMYLAANEVIPLAALKRACIVAAKSAGRWIVMLVAPGETEAIGVCRDQPRLVYSDDTMVLYACNNHVYRVEASRIIPEVVGDDNNGIVYTPGYRGGLEEYDGVPTIIIGYEDTRVLIPIEEYYAAFKDTLLVISGGWIYSLDISNSDKRAAITETNGCPLKLYTSLNPYLVLKLDVVGELSVEDISISGSSVSVCAAPQSLDKEYIDSIIRMYLAPPLIIEQSIRLPIPKPRVKINLYIAEDEIEVVGTGRGYKLKIGKGDAIVIARVDEHWLSLVHNAKFILMNKERDVIDVQPVESETILYAPKNTLTSELVLVLAVGKTIFEYPIEGEEKLHPPPAPGLRILGEPELTDTNRVAIRIEPVMIAEGGITLVNYEIVDNDEVELPLDRIPRVCGCRRLPGTRLLYCTCRDDVGLYERIKSRLAIVTRVRPERLLLLDIRSSTTRLYITAERRGLVHLKISEGETTLLARSFKLERGVNTVPLKLSIKHRRPFNTTLYITHAGGVILLNSVILPYRPVTCPAYRIGDWLVVCSEGFLVYQSRGAYKVSECAKLDETSRDRVILVMDRCGYLHKPVIEVTDLPAAIREAVRNASLLADKLATILQ